MRTLTGALVFVGGLAGLTYWAAQDHAEKMEGEIGGGAAEAVAGAVHGLKTEVDGRDIRVAGLADSKEEKAQILAALDDVEGRRVVRDDIKVLETVVPYSSTLEKAAGRIAAEGYVPHAYQRGELDELGAEGTGNMKLAAGAPEGWDGAMESGYLALEHLEAGRFSLDGDVLTLTGTARGPAERDAALAVLGDAGAGFELASEIEVLDDGTPPNYALALDASGGFSVNGKLPKGVSAEDFAKAAGLSKVSGETTESLLDEGDKGASALAFLGKLKPWGHVTESAAFKMAEGVGRGAIRLVKGADAELLTAQMNESFGDAVEISVSEATPEEGASRVNAFTGEEETYASGYWLPKTDFAPSLEACAAQAEDALAYKKINFVTGSDRLGPNAVAAINRVASVMRVCTIDGGFVAELGGHTDSTGNAEANLALSEARARSVVAALAQRGVPQGQMTALGYGAAEPIADNGTEEGRAANRRTTIKWTTP